MTIAGTISELWLYPVQTLGGQSCQSLSLTSSGIVGDRYYAVADLEAEKCANASRPTWKGMVQWQARYVDPIAAEMKEPLVEITFPDGERILSDDPRVDAALSDRLGRRLRLVRNDGTVAARSYNVEPCHFLSSATLKALANVYPQGRFEAKRFRPNVVLDMGGAVGFVEQDWMQRHVRVGEAELKVKESCVRCAMTTRKQGDLPDDPGILHTVTQFNQTRAGAYADIAKPGTVRLKDPFELLD